MDSEVEVHFEFHANHHLPYQSDCKGPAANGAFVALASNTCPRQLTACLQHHFARYGNVRRV